MIKCRNGFTLVEILIVTLIIGVILSISVPMYSNYIEKSRATQGMAGLLSYKQSVVICFSKTSLFSYCDEGQEGIPEGFEDLSHILITDDNYGITGLESVAVVDGVISAKFSAYNGIDGDNLFIVFTPYLNTNKTNILWNANCSVGADEYFDFC